MHHFLNKGLAQVSEYLAILLASIYVLRIINSKAFKDKLKNNQFIQEKIIKNKFIQEKIIKNKFIQDNAIYNKLIEINPIKIANKILRKYHKVIGITILFTGLIHGINSKQSVLSLNLGTATWVVSVLVGLSYMFKKQLSKIKPWIYIHRTLALLFLILLILHINL